MRYQIFPMLAYTIPSFYHFFYHHNISTYKKGLIKSHYRILFSELRNLDLELAKVLPGPQYDDVRGQYYFRIFNTLNWLSSMINEKMITDKKMIEHMKAVIARYYDETFVKNVSVDERDSKFYQEFTKLYRNIKK